MDSREDARPEPQGARLFEGRFVQTAATVGDVLTVTLDRDEHQFETGDPDGVKWMPRGTVLPAAGDWCAVMETSDGTWCVVVWTP